MAPSRRGKGASTQQPAKPELQALTRTDEFLAEILGELRTLNANTAKGAGPAEGDATVVDGI